ncbi:hypothetical protein VNO80_07537 [Phaseolus coccineus]|uniref:Uncharacterized protein n=1 Tax=Phaseolus coccineus TaxID=3886 RepID=A0AAN9NJZ2_PHACN
MNTQMKFFVVVVCLAVCIGTTWAGAHDSAKANEEKAKEAADPTVKASKESAASTADSAKDAAAPTADAPGPSVAEKSESFAQWAYHKISGGLGLKADSDKQPKKGQNAY